MRTSKFDLLLGMRQDLDQKIATLYALEADRADIDELVHQRTEILWAIADEISKNS